MNKKIQKIDKNANDFQVIGPINGNKYVRLVQFNDNERIIIEKLNEVIDIINNEILAKLIMNDMKIKSDIKDLGGEDNE